MTRTLARRQRKPPTERRDEIIAAACAVALAEGLYSVTLRRVAEALGIVPGLVNHYFPVADDLAAAAFAAAAQAEREAVFAAGPATASPAHKLKAMLEMLYGEGADAISLLWLDAWQASRSRHALRGEVSRQMAAWQEGLAALIAAGVAAGQFRVTDCNVAAMRILSLIDGMSVQAAIPQRMTYQAVREMVIDCSERELGCGPGGLTAYAESVSPPK